MTYPKPFKVQIGVFTFCCYFNTKVGLIFKKLKLLRTDILAGFIAFLTHSLATSFLPWKVNDAGLLMLDFDLNFLFKKYGSSKDPTLDQTTCLEWLS